MERTLICQTLSMSSTSSKPSLERPDPVSSSRKMAVTMAKWRPSNVRRTDLSYAAMIANQVCMDLDLLFKVLNDI